MYLKNELNYSKRSDHVTDDVIPLFWSLPLVIVPLNFNTTKNLKYAI